MPKLSGLKWNCAIRALLTGGLILLGTSSSSFAGDFKTDGSLDFTFQGPYYLETQPTAIPRSEQIFHLSAPLSAKWKKWLKFKFTPEAQWDPSNPSVREKSYWDVTEGYAQAQFRPVTLQAGMNVFTWGATDIANPLDIVSPRRFFDPLNSPKLGTPSLALKVDGSPISFEALYIPVQRKSILPGEQSRWLPRQMIRNRSVSTDDGPASILLPDPIVYSYADDQDIQAALKNNYGARLLGQFHGLDVSLVAFDGAAVAPATDLSLSGSIVSLKPQLVIQADSGVKITPVYFRHRVYGASVVYTLGEFILRAEGSYDLPLTSRADLPATTTSGVFEVEKSLSIGKDTITLIGELTYSHQDAAADNFSTSLSRIFDRAIILAVRYSPTEQISLLASLLHDTEFHGEFAHFEGSYAIRDWVKATLSADILGGETGTPIGTYADNDRVTAGLTLRW